MKREDEKNVKTQSPVSDQVKSLKDYHGGLAENETLREMLSVFEASVDNLDPETRTHIVDTHIRLLNSLRVMRQKLDDILSTEQGREFFEREAQQKLRSSE